jgi:hypothetical protein
MKSSNISQIQRNIHLFNSIKENNIVDVKKHLKQGATLSKEMIYASSVLEHFEMTMFLLRKLNKNLKSEQNCLYFSCAFGEFYTTKTLLKNIKFDKETLHDALLYAHMNESNYHKRIIIKILEENLNSSTT